MIIPLGLAASTISSALGSIMVAPRTLQALAVSIISLKFKEGSPVFPVFINQQSDPFIQRINNSGEKWIVFTDEHNNPKLALDADGFLRSELLCRAC